MTLEDCGIAQVKAWRHGCVKLAGRPKDHGLLSDSDRLFLLSVGLPRVISIDLSWSELESGMPLLSDILGIQHHERIGDLGRFIALGHTDYEWICVDSSRHGEVVDINVSEPTTYRLVNTTVSPPTVSDRKEPVRAYCFANTTLRRFACCQLWHEMVVERLRSMSNREADRQLIDMLASLDATIRSVDSAAMESVENLWPQMIEGLSI